MTTDVRGEQDGVQQEFQPFARCGIRQEQCRRAVQPDWEVRDDQNLELIESAGTKYEAPVVIRLGRFEDLEAFSAFPPPPQ
jgi:hypothetical protein